MTTLSNTRRLLGDARHHFPSTARLLVSSASVLTVGAISAAAPALAQSPTPLTAIEQIPSALKYGGRYHVQSGTWTRPQVAVESFGPDIIFNNSAGTGYFSTAGSSGGFASGSTNFDEGGLPGLTNGHPFAVGADREVYRVNGFQIGYCDLGSAASSSWEISFFESHLPCSASANPNAVIQTSGLPANGCWVIDVDLRGGQEFELRADGGDGWDDDPNLDSFGWSHRYTGDDLSINAGFLLTGDPQWTDPNWVPGQIPTAGTGTYYGGAGLCGPGVGTGYLTQDSWWLENPNDPMGSGCFAFGGYSNINGCGGPANPFASHHLQVYADAGLPPTFGDSYCQSEVNSTGAMTTISASGSDIATDNNVVLTGAQLPVGVLTLFLSSPDQGFVANPGTSAGNLCLSGPVGRFNQAGQIKASSSDGVVTLDTNIGEWSTGSIPIAIPPLSYAATAGMTSNFQLWHRDSAGGTSTSNFSDGLAVTWQ